MIDTILEISRQAGDAVLEIYRNLDARVELKKDLSPVTLADKHSSEIICRLLSENFGLPVLSEEGKLPSYADRKKWKKYFLVDPLDGTKDFLAKNDEFTINIALIDGTEPVIAVMSAPALRKTWWAQKGKGAFRIEASNGVQIFCKTHSRKIMAVSRFHNTPLSEAFRVWNDIHEVRSIGSALKLAYLADGEIDVYPRFEGSKEWDIAAGHLILKEAGGHIVDLTTGAEPTYNKPKLENNFFIAAAQNVSFFRVPPFE